jgi:hypothetical protein
MLVFHGSDVIVDKPRIIDPTRPLDFGGGFYVTTSKQQATEWTKRVLYRNKTNIGYLSIYNFDIISAEKELRILKFENADEKWLEFICSNRRKKPTTIEYDIVIGAVADDKVYRVVINYENGDINKDEALIRLKVEKLCDQILFHNEKALKYLKFEGSEVI